MHRWTPLALLPLVLASTPAYALDAWMWGVGPRVGTMALPNAFPARFNTTIQEEGAVQGVRGDVILGLDGVYYANSHARLVGGGAFDLGSHYVDANAMIKYDFVGQSDALDFILGGGAGAGTLHFTGKDQASLRVPYYPLRAEVGALIRDNSRGYQGLIFAQYDLPANQFYTDAEGTAVDKSDLKGFGFWGTVGVEVQVMFGDFQPPRPKHKSGGGGGGGGNGGGGAGGGGNGGGGGGD